MANDIDVDGDSLAATILTYPVHGLMEFSADGSFAYTPTPGLGNATDSFSYAIGDGHGGSSNATVTVFIKGTTYTTLTSSATPAMVGDAVTLTASVSAASGAPTGIVTFFDGNTVLGSGTLAYNGMVSITTSALPIGNHPITAVYGGNATAFSSSTSDVLIQTVISDQSIYFAPLADRLDGSRPVALGAAATSNLEVIFSVISGPATLDVNTLTITGEGTVVVEARQAGNEFYNPAPPVDQSFTVIPVPPASRLDSSFGVGGKVTASIGLPRQLRR